MRTLHPISCSLLFVTALGAQSPADALGERPPATGSVMRSAFGAFAIDGETAAAGPDYAARFTGSGIEFTPALGERAPRRLPVSFTLESIRRGTHTVIAAEPAAPVREGNFVRHARGRGIVESYEARVDGVEQTFRFSERPAGTGDLVVRGKVTTELPGKEHGEGIRFESPGIGGVSWGSVTGIDAAGWRVPGSLRLRGEHLELVLPAEFVDQATYPLLLDPLIGSITVLPGGTTDDYAPDVSYDATWNSYLVVWHRRFSSTNRTVYAQRVSAQTGSTLGGLIGITDTSANCYMPSVVNVNASDRFLVCYETPRASGGALVYGRLVNAADSAISPTYQFGTTDVAGGFDLGGNSDDQDDHAFVVMRTVLTSPSFDGVTVKTLRVAAIGPPGAVSVREFRDPGITQPRITRHGGSALRWLVTWQKPVAGLNRVFGGVIGSDYAHFPTVLTPLSPGTGDESAPDCATMDGINFAVAYERRSSPSAASDIACLMARAVPPSLSLTVFPERIIASGRDHQVTPAIDFAMTKYIVVWGSLAALGGARSIYTMGLSGNCVPCEHTTAIDTSAATDDYFPRIAARFSSGAGQNTNDEAMVVWESTETSSDVKAQRVRAIGAGGSVTAMGGSCASGSAGVNGPVALGNADFGFTLIGNTAPPLGLILGLSVVNLPCGPCTQVPSADFVYIGQPPYLLPIPCNVGLIGAPLYAQWLVLAPGGCPLAPFLGATTAIRAVIGV